MAAAQERRRVGGALGASALIHAVLLLALAWMAPVKVIWANSPDVQVRLIRPALLAERPAQRLSQRATSSTVSQSPQRQPARATASPTHSEPAARAFAPRAPAPPTPARSTSPTGGAGSGPVGGVASRGGSPGPLPGDAFGSDVRGALRTTVGCSDEDFVHLNRAEREECSRRFGAEARRFAGPSVDRIPGDKRGYYDAVRQAYEDVRNGDGKLPGVNCGARTPPNSIRLGPLPCHLTAPQGVLTEESGIARP